MQYRNIDISFGQQLAENTQGSAKSVPAGMRRQGWKSGFTIVELLIVIVVIGILAAITIVAYNGVQQRARDSERQSDVSAITKALELYYIDNGRYPAGSGSTTLNSSWSATIDASWQNLVDQLKRYMSSVPSDPANTPGLDLRRVANGYGYAYFTNVTPSYCGEGTGQMYLLVYEFESAPQKNTLIGPCPTNALSYSGVSNYRVSK